MLPPYKSSRPLIPRGVSAVVAGRVIACLLAVALSLVAAGGALAQNIRLAIAGDDVAVTTEDRSIDIPVLENDQGHPPIFIIRARILPVVGIGILPGPHGGQLAIKEGGRLLRFNPLNDFHDLKPGESRLVPATYMMRDARGLTDSGAVQITVTGVNDPPVAVNDTARTDEDGPVVIDVLANDTDVDGGEASPGIVRTLTPADDALVFIRKVDGRSQLVFDPRGRNSRLHNSFDALAQGASRVVGVLYTIQDEHGGRDDGTVVITVTGVNDPPRAGDGSFSTDEDAELRIDLTRLFSDVDERDTVTVIHHVISGLPPFPPGVEDGLRTLNGNVLVFDPRGLYDHLAVGERFEFGLFYLIRDNHGSLGGIPNLAITIHGVNDAPLAVDDNVRTNEDTPVSIDVLANDTDIDNDSLSVVAINDIPVVAGVPMPVAMGGTLTFNGGGEFIFDPNGEFEHLAAERPSSRRLTEVGLDFTYRIEDAAGATATGALNILVTGVNDLPVLVDDIAGTNEDELVRIDVLANDTDVDGDIIRLVNNTEVIDEDGTPVPDSEGLLGRDLEDVIVFDPRGAFDDLAPGENRIVRLRYEVTDDIRRNAIHSFGMVTITVTGVNDAPMAVDDTVRTDEDTPLTIDVLANDTDAEGDSLSVIAINDIPVVAGVPMPVAMGGTLTFNGGGEFIFDPNGEFEHLTTPSLPGSITAVGLDFTYRIEDAAGATVTGALNILVTGVNDPPVLVDDSAGTSEDEPVTIDVLANDTDVDSDILYLVTAEVVDESGTPVPDSGSVTYTNSAVTFNPRGAFDDLATGENRIVRLRYEIADGLEGNANRASGTVTVTVTGINDAPLVVDDTVITDEDTPVPVIDLLANDSDAEGDALTFIAASSTPGDSLPATGGGTLVFNADHTLRFDPNGEFEELGAGESRVVTAEYRITDVHGAAAAGTLTITVNGVNDVPQAVADAFVTDEDTPTPDLDVLANDTDADRNANLFIVAAEVIDGTGAPALFAGSVRFTGRTLRFDPDGGFDDLASDARRDARVRYTVSDGRGGTATGIVTITVTGINDGPFAVDDVASTVEDMPVTIAVTANDWDPEGDGFIVTLVQFLFTPNGVATVNGDNSITFQPDENFHGQARLAYRLRDEHGVVRLGDGADLSLDARATVTITVAPRNDTPLVTDDDAVTDENMPVRIDVLANDEDVDGDVLSVIGARVPSGNGAVVINADHSLTYTPNPDFNGADVIEYTVFDGNGGVATGRVAVMVVADNALVFEQSAYRFELAENRVGRGGAIPVGTVAVRDVLGRNITYDLPDPQAAERFRTTAAGVITYVGTGEDFESAPAGYTFEIRATDEVGLATTVPVTVTITDVNEPPQPLGEIPDLTLVVGGPPAVVDMSGLFFDPEGGRLYCFMVPRADILSSVRVVNTSDSHCRTATIIPLREDEGIIIVTGEDFVFPRLQSPPNTQREMRVRVLAAPARIFELAENRDGRTTPVPLGTLGLGDGFRYAITEGDATRFAVDDSGRFLYTGPGETVDQALPPRYHLEVTATDTGAGGGASRFTVYVTVLDLNDAPQAGDDTAETEEETPIRFAVLDNDADADRGDVLAVAGVIVPSGNGAVRVNADNTLTYTPVLNFHGEDIIEYTVSDGRGGIGRATVTMTVTPVNDFPVAVADAAGTGRGMPVVIAVLDNDTDVDGDALSVTRAEAGHGTVLINPDGTLRYAPDEDFTGVDTIHYVVFDGVATATGMVMVEVFETAGVLQAVNDTARTGAGTPVRIEVLANDRRGNSAGGGGLSVTRAIVPSGNGAVVINADNTLTYTPNPGFDGEDVIEYTASDNQGATDDAIVTVTVTPLNRAPQAADDAAEVLAGRSVTIQVLANDRDPDGDPLSVAGAILTRGDGTVVIDTANARDALTYTPAAGFTGDAVIEYDIADSRGATARAVVTVTVAPIAWDDVAATREEQEVTINVLANDGVGGTGDAELSVTGALVPTGDGTVVVNADNTLTYTPAKDFFGEDTIEYTISGGYGATVTVTVENINDPPVALRSRLVFPVKSKVPTVLHVLSSFEDVDNDPLSIEVLGENRQLGTVTVNADNSLTYTPAFSHRFGNLITIRVSDGRGGAVEADIDVQINDDPLPVAVNDVLTAPSLGTITIDVLANDLGEGLRIIAADFLEVSSNSMVRIDSSGFRDMLVYRSGSAIGESDRIRYTIEDGANQRDTAIIQIETVASDNQPPTANDDVAETREEQEVVINVLANDQDPDDDPLSIAGAIVPSGNGAVTVNADGSLRYTPAPDFFGMDTIRYTISDGNGGTARGRVTVTVSAADDPPAFAMDTWNFDLAESRDGRDTPVPVGTVMGGSPDGLVHTFFLLREDHDPTRFTVEGRTGQVLYIGAGEDFEEGTRQFSMTIRVAQGQTPDTRRSASVTVRITDVNEAPVFDAAAFAFSFPENVRGPQPLGAISATDPDAGDTLRYAIVSGDPRGVFAINPVSGALMYTGAGEDFETRPAYALMVRVMDSGGLSATTEVAVAIADRDEPPAFDLPAYNFNLAENRDGRVVPVALGTVTAADPEGADVAYAIAEGDATRFQIDPQSGAMEYIGAGEDFEADGGPPTYDLTITATSGSMTATASVSVVVTNENEPPMAMADEIEVNEGGTATTLADGTTTSVLANDDDEETPTDELTVSVNTPPANGTLTLNQDGTFRYVHNDGETTSDGFTYIVNDGFLDSNVATVTITITPVNDLPVAVNDAFTVTEGGTATTLTGGALSVRDNDSDVETATDALTVRVDTGPAHGALTLNADGTFSYAHNGDEEDSDRFTYIVNDGEDGGDSAPATVAITVMPENDAPVARDDAITVIEGGTTATLTDGITTSVTANDSDAETPADELTVRVGDGPDNGELTLNPNGTFSYAHDGGETLSDSFTYIANDGALDSNTATVAITITPVNDLPVAVNDAFTVVEGGTATTLTGGALSVRDNDSDVETATDALTVRVDTGPAHGALTLNADGTFSYAHNGDEEDSDRFTYIVNDGEDDSAPATVAITVTPENDAPVARDDAITVIEGGTTTTLAGGITTSVTANDSDAETPADDLTVRVGDGPDNGELTLNPNGTFSYAHDGGETLSDSFTYIANDGALDSNTATVAITITADNDAPVAVDDAIMVAEGGTATALTNGALSVLDNDTDTDTDAGALTVRVATGPDNGELTLNPDGTFSYVHDGGETRSDRFTYIVNDTERDSVPATVTITITGENDAPVAVDDAVETNEDEAVVFDVDTNDTDADGDALFVAAINGTAVISDQTVAVSGGGTLTFNGVGSLSFNPNGEFNGLAPDESRSVTATYRISDGRGGTDVGMVTIRVTGENDAPVAEADEITVAEGGTATTLADDTTTSVLNNDRDVDTAAGLLRVTLMAPPAHGALTLNPDGTFSYAHNGDEEDSDRFTYIVNDGFLDSAPATVTITITPVNDAPVAVDDAIRVAEGGTATTLVDGMTTSVTANDTDAETSADDLRVRVDDGPTNGTLNLDATGTFIYTHNGSETLSDSFTYIANDGEDDSAPATVTITITAENDAPVALADAFTVAEGGTATTLASGALSVRDNDSDAETARDNLVVEVVTGPDHGTLDLDADGTFSYVHNGDEEDTDFFTYRVNDGDLDSAPATVTITVTPQNDAPVAVDDRFETNEDTVAVFDVRSNDTDAENDPLTVVAINGTAVIAGDAQTIAVTGGGTLTLNADGRLSFNPNSAFQNLAPTENREVTARYQISDGRGGTAEAQVTIRVTGENDAPVAVADAFTVAENGTATTLTGGALSVRANDRDVDTAQNDLTVSRVTAPAHGTLTLNPDGTFIYVHDGDEENSDRFTYRVNDGALNSAPATVTITVTPVNDAPVAVADAFTVAEGGTATTLASGAFSVRDNDSDAETATNELTVSVDTEPANGALTLNTDGTFSYVHDGGETTSDFFTYTVNDAERNSEPATVTITVTGEDDIPVFGLPAYAFDLLENQNGSSTPVVVGTVTATDADVSDTPVYAIAGGDSQGKFVIGSASGTITYIGTGEDFEAPGGPPVYNLTITATAGALDATAAVTVTVTNANDPPVAVADAISTNEDTAITIDVLDNDTDQDDDPLSVIAINGTTASVGSPIAVMGGGTLTLNAVGRLSFNPNDEFENLAMGGSRSVMATYQISDGRGGMDEGTVTLRVTGLNDAPTADAGEPQIVAEGATVTLDGTGSSDPEEGTLTYQWVLTGGSGITLNDATIAQPTFTAPTGLTEDVSLGFRLVVTDDQNTASPPDTVTITVSASAVIGGDLSGTVVEDAPQDQATGTLAIINPGGADETFVAQDDPTPGVYGTFTLAANGVWTYTLDNSRAATTRLSTGEDGMETFAVMASASGIPGAMVRIMITGVNDAPVAVADVLATDEDTPMPVAVLDNDMDDEDDALSVAAINGATATIGNPVALPEGGTLTRNADGRLDFDPRGGFDELQVGIDRVVVVTYQITDGTNTADGTLTITVSGVNDAPVAVDDTADTTEDETVAIDVLANDTDAESDPLTVSAINGMAVNTDDMVALSGGGTLTLTVAGDLEFNPVGAFDDILPGASRMVTATYEIMDNQGAPAAADGDITITVTGVNDPPVFVGDPYIFMLIENQPGDGGTPVPVGMVAADDPDSGDTLTYAITTTTTLFNINPGSGAITYTGPGEDRETLPSHTLMVRVTDIAGATDTAMVTITIGNADEGPMFVPASYSFNLEENRNGRPPVVLGTVTATDPESDTIVYSITTGDTNRFSVGETSGAISYIGTGEDFETSPLTYALTVTATAGGLSATAAVTVTVSNANDPPVAVADAISTNEDMAVDIDVLANDTDQDTDTLSVIAINGMTVTNAGDRADVTGGGTLTLIVGDDLNFNPVGAFDNLLPGASRMVTATYEIMDNQGAPAAAAGDITITVTGVNDAPVFINLPYTFTLIENQPGDGGTPVPVGTVAADDPDTGDTLTYAITTTTTLFNIDPASGAITYTGPGEDLETLPSHTLMVRVTDIAGDTDTATVTINITNADEGPMFVPASYSFNLEENRDGTPPVVLGTVTATDPEMDAITYTITTGDTNRFRIDGTSGAISYIGAGEDFEMPPPTYALTITATANTLTDTASVTVTVTNVNEPPVFDPPSYTFTIAENRDGSTSPIVLDTVMATDPEDDTIVYSITTGDMTRFRIDEDSGAISYTGAGEDFEAPGGPPTYDLTITATAGGQTATAPVTVRVTAANDAPVAENDAITVPEGGTARALTGGATSVLANDRDVDTARGSLTANVVTPPANGALTLNRNGTFTYTHDDSETTGDSFTYLVNDGALDSNTATVTITVTADNDAPTAEAGQPQTVAEGATVTLDGSASSDPENDALTFAWTQLSGAQVTLDDTAAARPIFTAPTELLSAAVLEFRLIVADPQNAASAPDTVTITVTAGANDAPTAHAGPDQTVDEDAVVSVTLDGSASTDPEGETLLYEWSQTSGPEVSLAGMTTVRPTFAVPQQLTDDIVLVFSLTVEDVQSTSNPDTVMITVTANDDSPVAVDDRIVITRDATATTLADGADSVLDNDRDPDTAHSGLTARMMTSPKYGALTLNEEDGTFIYTHDDSETDSDFFTYLVNDGMSDSNIATVTVAMQTGRERHARVMKGWLARFGRTVASDAGESISERMSGSPGQAGASWVVIGGHRMSLDAAQPPDATPQIPFTRDPDEWSRQADADSEVMSSRELLTRSAFQINLHEDGAGGNAAGGNVVLWGRGTGSSFDGKDIDKDNEADVLTLSGDVTSVTFGLESIDENTRGGIALTHSEGEGEWDFGEANDSEGDLEASLTSLYPYVHWASPNGWEVWGLLGYGRGEMRLEEAGEAAQETDIKMGMMSLGARYDLFAGRTFGLALKGDALALRIESKETEQLAEIKDDVQRGRLSLEGTHAPILDSGNRVRTTLELGVRQDAGDAETGAGGDVGVSFNYANPDAGLDFTIQGRYLVDHEDKNFEDWSGSVAARFDPGAPGRGLALTLEPEWTDAGHSQRLTVDFAGVWKDRGWRIPPGLRLELYGTRREQEDASAEHSVGLTFSFRF